MGDDGSVDVDRCRQVALMHAHLVPAEAHHHVAVMRQPARRDALETERSETREQFVRVSRRTVEVQRELRRLHAPAIQDRLQRAKHFTGPATKSRSGSDHSSVDTSMSFSVIRMLFTDDGRPPRDRLLIVPEVEMIVPRFVCSM